MRSIGENLRFELYDEIYFSPHFDDVVYSCGGRIAQQRKAGKRVLVVTVFGDDSQEPFFRVARRFGDFRTRREEDQAALTRLDADYAWFNHADFLFRRPSLGDAWRVVYPFSRLPSSALRSEVTDDVRQLCEQRLAEGGRVWCPLAVGFHADHRIVCDAGRALHAQDRCRVEFYEDIPYAHYPVNVALRLRALGVPAATMFPRSALEANAAFAKFFGIPSKLALVPFLFYVPLLEIAQRLLGSEDRHPEQAAPQPMPVQRIDDAIEDKVAAVRMYASQTALLLTTDDRLHQLLGGRDGYVERSWRFPHAAHPRSARLTREVAEKLRPWRPRRPAP